MNHQRQTIVAAIASDVKQKLAGSESGHDWWHVLRVWNTAKHIGQKENADMFIVELAALLHDIADWKFHGGDDTVGPKVAREYMEKHSVPAGVIDEVCDIIATMSYKGAGVKTEMKTLAGKIVQDADRLDALGAIGIARAFAYGGHKNRELYNPDEKPVLHETKEAYIQSKGHTINHFYEKLLLLKDRMNTATGKSLATERHDFMEVYLTHFFNEWNGKK